MKKLLFFAALVAISTTTTAQVGINTTTPQGAFDVVSSNSGVVFPRLTSIGNAVAPINGMIVYVVDEKCFKGYADSKWNDITPCSVPSVTSPTGKIWMNKNLGASQVATSSTDAASYGDLYQWGRFTDGHQLRNSSLSAIDATSGTDEPGNANFIPVSAGTNNNDWRTGGNNLLWQGLSGINNPCPSGYRLPTDTELDAEIAVFSTKNAAGAWASVLKLPAAGNRSSVDGSLVNEGSYGYYWSSTVTESSVGLARRLRFTPTASIMNSSSKASGISVRCIKD